MAKFKQYKRLTEKIYKVPNSITDTIPVNRISEKGIFELEAGSSIVKLYDKAYVFEDINYHTRDEDEKKVLLDRFRQFLNSMNVSFKIIVSNEPESVEELNTSIFEKARSEKEEPLAREFNKYYLRKVGDNKKGINQVRYFIISCLKADYDSANAYFNTIEGQLERSFKSMGSGLLPLNGTQRLRLLHNIYRFGNEKTFRFSWDDAFSQRRDWRHDIINTSIKEHENYLTFDFGKSYVSVLFIKNYPSSLKDTFIQELMALSIPIILTMDIEPIGSDFASKMLKDKYMTAQGSIDRQQITKNKMGAYSSDVSYNKRKEVEELEDAMDILRSDNEKMFYVDVLIAVMAKSRDELNNYVEQVKTVGNTFTLEIEEHVVQQLNAFNTVLPTAARFVNTMRPMFTTSLSGITPFNVTEINDRNGFFYGINQVSKNAIIGNRKKLKNGNGFIFGKSGAGKSLDAKGEIGQVLTYTDDDVIIIDPMGEYEPITQEWNGNYYKFTNKASDNKIYKNPYHVPEYVNDEDMEEFIADKAEFSYALFEQGIKPDVLSNKHINAIDKAVKMMYEEYFQKRKCGESVMSPTMVNLRECFLKLDDKYSRDMAEQMEIFTSGTLNVFAHQETDIRHNRLEVYGLSELGKKTKKMAMLISIEAIKSRLKYNFNNKKATWIYIDEVHELWKDEYSQVALEDLWREVRKQGGLCTGMTQFIMDGLKNASTASMIGNSEFTLLLEQGSIDKGNLFDIFEVSQAQLDYVNGVDPGTGLIRFGKKIVPFDNIMSRDSKLYKLFNTSFHDENDNGDGDVFAV